jgi:Zn-dependent peptidase ImmA (M78 family)
MDLAHELAHLVLDADSTVDEEDFARRFAGALLLPAETVFAELGSRRSTLAFSELRALKMRYGVSMQGWIRRAKDLHIISESAYTGLQIQINRFKLRADEGEPYVALEICDRDMRLAARAIAEGLLDATEAARLAGIDPASLTNGTPPAKRRPFAGMSREERRAAMLKAAAATAQDHIKHPEDRLPDIFDHAD